MTTIKLNAIEKRDLIIHLAHIISELYIQTQFIDPEDDVLREIIRFNLAKIHTIESIMNTICNIGYILDDFTTRGVNDVWQRGCNAGYDIIKNVLYNKFGIRIDD